MDTDLCGMKVIYRSRSGKEYEAIITKVDTESSEVSLIFQDNRGKYMKKEKVKKVSEEDKVKVWIYSEGKYAWKDGMFVDEE